MSCSSNPRSRRTRAISRAPAPPRGALCVLHLVKPLGFEISDKYLKRAGLDYWHLVRVELHETAEEALFGVPEEKLHFFTTKSPRVYSEARLCEGDYLVFGKETKGLPDELLLAHPAACVRIPMREEARSLNLSNSVAVAVYEGLRQNGFGALSTEDAEHRLDLS